MDELFAALATGASVASGLAGYLLGRRGQAGPESASTVVVPTTPVRMIEHDGKPYEVNGRKFAPARGHRHEYTVMVDDGWGWRCGVVTDGIECGRPKEARRGI